MEGVTNVHVFTNDDLPLLQQVYLGKSRILESKSLCHDYNLWHRRDPVMPGAQGSPREREGRRMVQACGGEARRPRGGMVGLLGPGGGARDATSQIPRISEAGGRGEEVGRRIRCQAG